MTEIYRLLNRIAVVNDEISPDFAKVLDVCAPLGIQAFELRNLPGGRIPFCAPKDLDEIERWLRTYPICVTGISPGFFKKDINDTTNSFDINDGFDAAFRLLERLNVNRMTVFSCSRSIPEDPIPAKVVDLLGCAVKRCQSHGVELLIENSAACWGDTGQHLGEIARAVGAGVTWDPGNAQASGEIAYPFGYQSVKPFIRHVHLKNWSAADGITEIMNGEIDYGAQIHALEQDGYAGYYCLEPHQWDNGAEAVRRNFTQLKDILAKEEL